MALPEEKWIGYFLILLGLGVFFFDVRIEDGSVIAKGLRKTRIRLNVYLLIAVISGLLCASALGGYFIDRARDKIVWDYDKWPDTTFLSMQGSPGTAGYPIWV